MRRPGKLRSRSNRDQRSAPSRPATSGTRRGAAGSAPTGADRPSTTSAPNVRWRIRTCGLTPAAPPVHVPVPPAVEQLVLTPTPDATGYVLPPQDLLGTGTISGPQAGQGGSLLELSKGGKSALQLPGGEKRSFLEDGDTLILKAFCEAPGAARIGLGQVAGTVLPAA